MPSKTTVPDPTPTAYSMATLAKMMGTSLDTIQRGVMAGEIPSFKIGRTRRIPADAVEALMRPSKHDDDDLDAYVRKLVDAAPRLTEAQRRRLSSIIQGAS
jgi:excisionase family DNA binding protein